MTNFASAHPALNEALTARGYETLTQVQEAVLDPELSGADLLVSAQTGSGKTVAFGLAAAATLLGEYEQFKPAGSPLALAIAPTRELALQVKRELEWLYARSGARLASCVGGMDMRDERRALSKGVHIVVGTPGRLCDHIKRGSLDMSALKVVILDEADEMLKMGFREELEMILGASPSERRTLMFSATVPKTIAGLAKKYQRAAIRVNTAAEARQHIDIEYRAMVVAKSDQENAIINSLRYYDAKNAIVFAATRVSVNRMTARFNNRGFSVVALSGELSQKERTHALQAMRDGRAKVCIATDVAARGLDLPDLELVIHADIPKNPEGLLHRSGRTGRAGRKGVSALIVPHAARRRTERLFNAAGITAEWTIPPSAEAVLERDNERLLSDPMLTEAVSEKEADVIDDMLKAYSPDQIAAAFIRQYRSTRSAPEELIDAPAYDPDRDSHKGRNPRKPRARNDFEDGVWYTLNLGRKQKAEPRWILPMLCKSGDLKKGEIGSIKISEKTTYVEIAPSGLERFIAAIGPDGKIEKAITAHRVDGVPDFNTASSKADKAAHKTQSEQSEQRQKAPYNKKRAAREAAHADGTAKPEYGSEDSGYRETGKKPHKKKLAKAAARKQRRNATGAAKKKTRKNNPGGSAGGGKLKRKPRK